eukprot:TRINITY_DN14634_c0_g1_i3.p2 TRINITY_DN14634_c0_g1~~TRINITY_DN14634_c0_g1_i3.p2  ORF type:complete len:115 (+),score=20.09 TRINITY_DN14634_c0_g1_i3:82-426(+)
MGSICLTKSKQTEAEIISSQDGSEKSDYMNSASRSNNSLSYIDLEGQFAVMLNEIPIPEGELKEKLEELSEFDFGPAKDSRRLAIVKGSELVEDELYFGFLYSFFYRLVIPYRT